MSAVDPQKQGSLIRQLQGAMGGAVKAAGKVTGSGGSSYSLTSSANTASVAGQATGQCRVVLNGSAASTNNIWPQATVNDNSSFSATCIVVSASPVTFDVYQWSTSAGATNRGFFFSCEFLPA